MDRSNLSRRNFLRGLGGAAGAASLGFPTELHATIATRLPTFGAPSPFPELNPRALGWLHYLHRKATTPDDWGRWGVPHQWWDVYSSPGVTSFGRFDLSYSSYAILMMADQTPAWREVYTTIMDQMAARYPTYWGAVDWLTQIGDDPARGDYPPQFMLQIREDLRGNYNRIGWTANGVEPWGLQPDPIGADGNLFFRGWFNLMLSIYKYVSGDTKWEQPFSVTGYQDQEFEWDQHRIVDLLQRQYREHPEGPHCENTKIWPYCNTAAGLGMFLYDRVNGRSSHGVVNDWIQYLTDNYIGVDGAGNLEWVTTWYDPLIDYKANGGPAGGILFAFLMLPQNRELATYLYETAATALGWNDPSAPVRLNSTGLLLARELGDDTSYARLMAAAEENYEPRFFGDHGENFGWFFGLPEAYPRGQQSATMMIAEVGQAGDWVRAFDVPHMDKFSAPTVEGIDYPSLGVSQAWNDREGGALHVATYPVTPDRAGMPTNWTVTNLPDPDQVVILCDGQPFDRFETTGANSIRLDTDTDPHRYQIFTGYRGQGVAANAAEPAGRAATGAGAGLVFAERSSDRGPEAAGSSGRDFLSGPGPGCPCC